MLKQLTAKFVGRPFSLMITGWNKSNDVILYHPVLCAVSISYLVFTSFIAQ